MPAPDKLTYTKDLDGASYRFSLSRDDTSPAEILDLIATNARLSEINSGALIRLGLKAENEKVFRFPGVSADGSLRVQGGVSAVVGFYPTGQKALESVGFQETTRMHDLPYEPDERYGVLAWNYDFNASANAGMALSGTVSTRLSLDGSQIGHFAVLRPYKETEIVSKAIEELVQAWKTPGQIESADDLPVGTSVVTEVYGRIRFAIDSSLGLDFNWVRGASGGKISGDIGLKLMIGLETQFGFQLDGKFVLWILREKNGGVLRLKLYKQRNRGWNFALGLRAQFKPELPLPEDPDALIEAMLGIHGERIIKDLKALERWTSPETPPIGALAGISAGYLKTFLQEVTGLDPDVQFEKARSTIGKWIALWEDIPQSATALLWKWAQDHKTLSQLKEFAQKLAEAEESAVREIIKDLYSKPAAHRDPGFMLAEQLAGGPLWRAVNNPRLLAALRRHANTVRRILDGSEAEELLIKLKRALDARLNIKKFLEGSENSLDEWLEAKIEQLLEEKLGNHRLQRLEELRGAIQKILQQKDELYKKVREAALRQYSFALSASYERMSENSVLVDAAFDTSITEARQQLKKAIRGDFTDIFTRVFEIDGVAVHSARITQELRRTVNVKLSLPWTAHTSIHTMKAIAAASLASAENGKEIVFDLKADDTIEKRAASRFALTSALSIGFGASRHLRDGEALILYDRNSGRVSYVLRLGRKRMKAAALAELLKSSAARYFSEEIGTVFEGRKSGTIDDFVSELDRRVDEEMKNGENMLGDTLVELVLEYPGHVLEGWLSAPEERLDPVYRQLSVAMQKILKEALLDVFLANPDNLKAIGAAAPILVWASLPAELGKKGELYWNWHDRERQRSMAWLKETREKLRWILRFKVAPLLDESSEPALKRLAADYDIENHVDMDLIQMTLNSGSAQFEALLYFESSVIHEAASAGRDIAQWMGGAKTNPQESVKRLAQIGEKLVSAFHGKMASVYAPDLMRAVGARLLIEAGRIFGGEERRPTEEPFATLYIGVLKEGADFKIERFSQGERPGADAMVAEVQLVNLPDEIDA